MSSLRHFIIPEGITRMGDYAVMNNPNLEWFIIPSTVTIIDWGASRVIGGNPKLRYIQINAVTPPALNGSAISGNNNEYIIYVPDKSVEVYKAAVMWNTYSSRIKPISEFAE